jgi:hypothetical protein
MDEQPIQQRVSVFEAELQALLSKYKIKIVHKIIPFQKEGLPIEIQMALTVIQSKVTIQTQYQDDVEA